MNPRARSRSHRTHSDFIVVSGACSCWAKGASEGWARSGGADVGAAACASNTLGDGREGLMCCSDEGNGGRRRGIDVRSEVILDCEQRRRSPGNTTERHGFHTKTGPTTSRTGTIESQPPLTPHAATKITPSISTPPAYGRYLGHQRHTARPPAPRWLPRRTCAAPTSVRDAAELSRKTRPS